MQPFLKSAPFKDTIFRLQEKVSRRGINYSLDRLNGALKKLNHPEKTLPSTIHIAGTNGKGSVAHYLTQGLIQQRRQVVTYTSPHIQCYTERFLINGSPISQGMFSDLFNHISHADLANELSEYEVLTLMAFELVRQISPEVFIMETGMGGRLDATNVVPSSMAVITDIGLDHTQILGTTLMGIAKEKAGIIKENSLVITHIDHDPAIIEVIKETSKQHNSTIHWSASEPNFHERNKRLSVIALNELLSIDHGEEIISNISPPFGRLSKFNYQGISCWVDVGHNLHAAQAIQKTLPSTHQWIVGMSKEKDLIPIIQFLMDQSKSIALCSFRSNNCWTMDDLPSDIAPHVHPWKLGDMLQQGALFFGSFYFIEKLLENTA